MPTASSIGSDAEPSLAIPYEASWTLKKSPELAARGSREARGRSRWPTGSAQVTVPVNPANANGGGPHEGPCRSNCQGAGGSPRTSPGTIGRGRAGYRSRIARASRRSWQGDWPARAHSEIHAHDSGCGGDEAQKAPNTRNFRIECPQKPALALRSREYCAPAAFAEKWPRKSSLISLTV